MNLGKKIRKSKNILQKALDAHEINKIALAWTGGKDSTVILHMIREYLGDVPMPVYFNDSGLEFPEVLKFVENIEKKWNLNLIRHPHSEADMRLIKSTKDPLVAREAKIRSIARAVAEFDLDAFIVGIRSDEHDARSDEKEIKKHKNHTRYHPIIHFTEDDIWTYIHKFSVPYVPLYDEGYRSLGEAPFTKPSEKGKGERSGRDQDKEKVMKRLRSLGYW